MFPHVLSFDEVQVPACITSKIGKLAAKLEEKIVHADHPFRKTLHRIRVESN